MLLGIVVAFKEEVNDYLKRRKFRVAAREGELKLYQSRLETDVVIVQGGVGRQRCQQATKLLAEKFQPEFIIGAGFSAGVQQGLRPGDLFLCDRLLALEGPAALWQVDDAKEQTIERETLEDKFFNDAGEDRPRYTVGACLSVPEFVSGSSMKAWIGATYPVSIIDMESFWVSETARELGVPHAIVRSVLDPVEQTLPPFIGGAVENEDRRSWTSAAKYIVSKPGEVPKLVHLASQAKVARSSLCEFLAALKTEDEAPRNAAAG